MAEESWNAARLIPTSGINGAEEQERRATSALLAVLSAVKEFGRAIVAPLGAPAGTVETYIEVPFTLGDKRLYPDGLVRVSRGQRSWTALVEVKTGTNTLAAEQLENYLDIAREQGYDAVITISNEVPAVRGQHPTIVDRRKLRKVALHHLPWVEVLAEAVMQKEFRGVADPDQAWILGELIRYLEHPRSGAMSFEDMGASWVPVREAVHAGTLRAGDKGIQDVASKFDALLRYAGLRLGQRLGADVQPALTRKELADPALRSQALVQTLSAHGTLAGGIRIPGATATITITADLRANQIHCSCELDAPKQGRPKTRVTWLLRQLEKATDTLRVEAFTMHSRGPGTAELLRTVRDNPDLLITDPTRELRAFRLTQITPLGAKRGTGRGAFIDSVIDGVDTFYEEVVQHLRSWTAPPPRLRDDPETDDAGVRTALISAGLSSQDDPEPAGHEAPAVAPSREASAEPASRAAHDDDIELTGSEEPTGSDAWSDVERTESEDPGGAHEPAAALAPAAREPVPAGIDRATASSHPMPRRTASDAAAWSSYAPAPAVVRPLPSAFT
ncbi:hypothetical protein [Kineosporia sp. R_H_3]|uniref:hypothetical protein n=1 Tax=Kineosporia sp. R_H_3 TaxID=1961848 RepID=UPI0018E99111|nr:hypothetical protein [Kineosporia sp. R_H_3]